MLAALLADHETLVRNLRKDLETGRIRWATPAPTDFLTGLLEVHEKMAWMLRSDLAPATAEVRGMLVAVC